MKDISIVVESLNDALKRDPVAMSVLVRNMVSCNEDFSNHPTISCWQIQEGHSVTALGLVNGVLSALGLTVIEAQWNGEPNADGICDLIGFREYKPDSEKDD